MSARVVTTCRALRSCNAVADALVTRHMTCILGSLGLEKHTAQAPVLAGAAALIRKVSANHLHQHQPGAIVTKSPAEVFGVAPEDKARSS